MQNKFIFSAVKCFFYSALLILVISLTQIFSGCGGSEEEEVTQRDKDSITVYMGLQKSFSMYKKGLAFNESSDNQKTKESFEAALKYLNEINYELISKGEYYFWKQDYNELAKSIVEDYFITQTEIDQQSLVFEFAKRVPVSYERVEEVSSTGREPLPEGSDVPLIRNYAVDQYIEFFSNTDRGRSFIDKCMYRSGKYFPLMRKILKLNNAPEELIYLSVQESGLNPTIKSRAGAVGLWQFMPATGRSYGLDEDGYRDDRRDFEKATDAAAHLLKDLYKTYDDWYLAFSAYNAGPGRVNSAIRKGGSRDFWSIRGYLPGETKNYVPSIIALSFVLRNPEEYGFKDVEYGAPVAFDRVNIKCNISLQRVSDLCESDIETIRELNPELTNDEIPLYDEEYQLRIPHKSYDKFASNFAKANDISGSSPEFAGTEVTGFTETSGPAYYKVQNYNPGDPKTIASANGKKKVSHEYKKKEQLGAIAVYYDVRPTDIRVWNNLSYGERLKSKQKLSIYLTEENYKKLYGEGKIIENNETAVKETEETSNENVSKDDGYGSDKNKEVTTNETPVKVEDNSGQTTIPESPTESTTTDESSDNESDEVSDTNTDQTMTETSGSQEPEPQQTYTESTDTQESETVQTQTHQPETKTVSNKNNTGLKSYTVKEGDNLSSLANEFGVSISDLKEWNDLESDNIMVGQKLKVKPVNTKTSIHTVKEGENLTMIADEYGLSLAELKELNNISDDKILVGQKLKVIESNTASTFKKNTTKTSGVKKTYKVKKGETLASIAESNDISINDIIAWNNLKNDKILVGQILKLYDDGVKQKKSKKKN